MNTIIRPYIGSDLSELLEAWGKSTSLAHPFLSESFLAQEKINIPNMYLPNADTWVVEDEGKVVGFIALIGNEVGAIFVDPKCHGRGLGKALMDKAQSLHARLEVEVFKENHIGRNFYDRYGFKYLEEKVFETTGDKVLRLKSVT